MQQLLTHAQEGGASTCLSCKGLEAPLLAKRKSLHACLPVSSVHLPALQDVEPTDEAAHLQAEVGDAPGRPLAVPAGPEAAAAADTGPKGKGKKRTREDILEREKNKQARAKEEAAQKAQWTDLKHNTSVYVQGLPEDVTEEEFVEVGLHEVACCRAGCAQGWPVLLSPGVRVSGRAGGGRAKRHYPLQAWPLKSVYAEPRGWGNTVLL